MTHFLPFFGLLARGTASVAAHTERGCAFHRERVVLPFRDKLTIWEPRKTLTAIADFDMRRRSTLFTERKRGPVYGQNYVNAVKVVSLRRWCVYAYIKVCAGAIVAR